MGDLVNLRTVKKQRARAAAAEQAAANRAAHGRTPAEKSNETQAKARVDRTLDQARIEKPEITG